MSTLLQLDKTMAITTRSMHELKHAGSASLVGFTQANSQLEPVHVSEPPFLTTVRLPAPESPLRVDVQLGFTDAAHPGWRQVSFEYATELSAGQHSQWKATQLNGTHPGVRPAAAKSGAVIAPGYATRSGSRTDNDKLVNERHGTDRTVRIKRQRT